MGDGVLQHQSEQTPERGGDSTCNSESISGVWENSVTESDQRRILKRKKGRAQSKEKSRTKREKRSSEGKKKVISETSSKGKEKCQG